jgi:methionyl-tRNA formyltransferase
MGASLQTLDEKKFDHGVILSQTPRPGIRIAENTTLAQINRRMATECAELLIDGLRSGVHIPPYVDAGWMAGEMEAEGRALQHAPKMSKADFQIDWVNWTATDWRRRLQVSQSVWTHISVPRQDNREDGAQKQLRRRVIFHDAQEVSVAEVTGRRGTIDAVHLRPDGKEADGCYRQVVSLDEQTGVVYILLGHIWIRCQRATLEGKLERTAAVSVHKLVVFDDICS